MLFCHPEALRHLVNSNDMFGPEHVGTFDGELSNRTAAPDGDRVAWLDVAVLYGHIAGGKNIGEKEHFLIWNAIGDLKGAHIGEGNA
jgi:hypothetical protein